MNGNEVFLIFPQQPVLSVLLSFFILTVVLYFARRPAHHFITAITHALHGALRLAAFSLKRAAAKMTQRNREVLLAEGREAAEHIIEREFARVDATLQRDMAEYPALQRHLNEVITNIDEDYQQSSEVPPSPPGWTKAVAAVAKIPSSEDPMVVDILGGINDSLVKAHDKAISEYRNTTRERHALLKTMAPEWRKLQQTLGQMGRHVDTLMDRSKTIDRHMDEYEEIMQGSVKAQRTLSSSSITQFFIAAFVLAIAIGGAMINYNLIARPMAEMVGGGSYLMGFKTANIAAMVIILVEVAMGLFLMESLRITRLFPTIGALDDKMRKRMIWATFIMLFTLASIEAGLAYMRELLSQDDAALVAGLLNGGPMLAGDAASRWITTAAQMGMGFILPFALTFVAIPLETFIHATRTVLGILTVGLLHALAGLLRIAGNGSRHVGQALLNLYDLLIFAPLWVEQRLATRRVRPQAEKVKTARIEKGTPREERPHSDTLPLQVATAGAHS
jgi:hypothetical protein